MLSDRCLSVLSVYVLSVGNVGVLWPNGWIDQDATWYGSTPRLRPSSVERGPSPPRKKKGAQPVIFGPCLLRPNGWMYQDATWHGGRPRPRPHCVLDGVLQLPRKGHVQQPLFSAHVYCGHGRPSQLLLSSCQFSP